jgi:hypothetical protein
MLNHKPRTTIIFDDWSSVNQRQRHTTHCSIAASRVALDHTNSVLFVVKHEAYTKRMLAARKAMHTRLEHSRRDEIWSLAGKRRMASLDEVYARWVHRARTSSNIGEVANIAPTTRWEVSDSSIEWMMIQSRLNRSIEWDPE